MRGFLRKNEGKSKHYNSILRFHYIFFYAVSVWSLKNKNLSLSNAKIKINKQVQGPRAVAPRVGAMGPVISNSHRIAHKLPHPCCWNVNSVSAIVLHFENRICQIQILKIRQRIFRKWATILVKNVTDAIRGMILVMCLNFYYSRILLVISYILLQWGSAFKTRLNMTYDTIELTQLIVTACHFNNYSEFIRYSWSRQ